MEIIKKDRTPEYKEELKKEKIKKYSDLEDFVTSKGFKEYLQLMGSVIEGVQNNILNDESPAENEVKYSMKMLKILLRKELIKFRNQPISRLKILSHNIDSIGATE